MCFYHSNTVPLENSFAEQLNTLSEKNPQMVRLKYTLKLPNQTRYHYSDPSYIQTELSKVLKKRYPLGFEIINLAPSSNDDHFINIVLQVRLQ